jgi:hypothetical protein
MLQSRQGNLLFELLLINLATVLDKLIICAALWASTTTIGTYGIGVHDLAVGAHDLEGGVQDALDYADQCNLNLHMASCATQHDNSTSEACAGSGSCCGKAPDNAPAKEIVKV